MRHTSRALAVRFFPISEPPKSREQEVSTRRRLRPAPCPTDEGAVVIWWYHDSCRAGGRKAMRRREFITLLGGAAAWPMTARAQQPAVPIIGFVSAGSPQGYEGVFAGFLKGLDETGYVEGHNVAIQVRWAEGRNDRLPCRRFDPAQGERDCRD